MQQYSNVVRAGWKMRFATELRRLGQGSNLVAEHNRTLQPVDSADSSEQDWHSVFKGTTFYQYQL